MIVDLSKIMAAVTMIIITRALCSAADFNFEEFEQELDRGAVVVTKPEKHEDGTVCGRVLGVVDAPVDDVWTVVNDYNNIHELLPMLSITYVVDETVIGKISNRENWGRGEFEKMLQKYRLDKPDSDTLYFYNVISMPFIFADRWNLLKVVRNHTEHVMQWSLIIGNMVTNTGSWEFLEFDKPGQRTLSIYTIYSNLGIPMPKFIVNLALNKALPSIINCLRSKICPQPDDWVAVDDEFAK